MKDSLGRLLGWFGIHRSEPVDFAGENVIELFGKRILMMEPGGGWRAWRTFAMKTPTAEGIPQKGDCHPVSALLVAEEPTPPVWNDGYWLVSVAYHRKNLPILGGFWIDDNRFHTGRIAV